MAVRNSMTLLCWQRLLSSSSTPPIITNSLKSRLRQLYKRVHPDLFQHDAAAQRDNERSFKNLQEYLQAAENGARTGGGAASVGYRFTFHLKPQPNEENSNIQNAAGQNVIAMTLPPPSRALPRDTYQALNRLFNACGVPDVSFQKPDQHGAHPTSITNLREFIPHAAELLHQAAARGGGDAHELHRAAAIRAALQLAHRISLVFGGSAAAASARRKGAAAARLLSVLQKGALDRMAGLQVGLGDGFGLDTFGTIWLHATARPTEWAAYLKTADVSWCHAQRQKAVAQRDAERAAAQNLGIGSIIAHPDGVILTDAYAKFLERLKAADVVRTGLWDASAKTNVATGVTLMVKAVWNADNEDSLSDHDSKVVVSVDASPSEVVSALRRHGPEVRRRLELQAREHAELATLRHQVERKLRLRQLARHPDLAAYKFRAGCLRLLQHASSLSQLLGGLSIRLASTNAYIPGAPAIDVAWDFTV